MTYYVAEESYKLVSRGKMSNIKVPPLLLHNDIMSLIHCKGTLVLLRCEYYLLTPTEILNGWKSVILSFYCHDYIHVFKLKRTYVLLFLMDENDLIFFPYENSYIAYCYYSYYIKNN